MLLKSHANRKFQWVRKLPLRLVLVVPFVLQIFAAVGLMGYLSLQEGLDTREFQPDLTIADLSMPAIDGFEMNQRLRSRQPSKMH